MPPLTVVPVGHAFKQSDQIGFVADLYSESVRCVHHTLPLHQAHCFLSWHSARVATFFHAGRRGSLRAGAAVG